MSMNVLKGKGVFGGISFGKIHIYKRSQNHITRYAIDDTDLEIKRYEEARAKTLDQLQSLYDKALQEVGEANAMIFQIHKMMLEDLDYCESIVSIIKNQKVNAEYAVETTGANFSEMFSSMEDSYMKERSADVEDVSKRLVSVLLNENNSNDLSLEEPVIIAADDLAPSETVQLDKSKVLGFITKKGSASSHTAILARTMNIPAIIGVGSQLKEKYDEADAIIDGFSGEIYIEPDEETIAALREKQLLKEEQRNLLLQLKGKDNITLDGQKIEICANIGNIDDIGAVMQNDADGIGLFRSEFLYLGRKNYPTEEEQFQVYKDVAEKMSGKRVIIRTLDIGADKQVDYFKMPKEENPAMGVRAIRICLNRPDVFKTQLRALLRASAFGKISVMFPMITSCDEVERIKQILAEAKAELDQKGIAYSDDMEVGIMIETPAAAIISDELAKMVDFFSVGTNDLTQYTMAIDRQNEDAAAFLNTHHKALIRLLKLTSDNAHKNGIWIGICGELGSDPDLLETFLAIGIDELSVSPSSILGLKKLIREKDMTPIRSDILKSIW